MRFFQSFEITPQPLLWDAVCSPNGLGELGVAQKAFLVGPVHTMEVAVEDENWQNRNERAQVHQNDLENQTEI